MGQPGAIVVGMTSQSWTPGVTAYIRRVAEISATDYAAVHRDAMARVTELVGTLDDADLVRMVPACPGWTVLDVTRHLTGLAVDLSGRRCQAPRAGWRRSWIDDTSTVARP